MKPLKLLSNIFKRADVVNEEHLAMIDTIEKVLSQIKDDTDLIKLEMLISSATGDWLNTWGDWFGVKRLSEEEDENYRKRILAVITKPKNTIPALIATARAYIGDETANVKVYEPHNDLRKFNISQWGSQDRYQDGEYYSVGVADIYIPVPLTPVLRKTVDQAKAAGIRIYYTMLGELGDGQIFDMTAKNPPTSDNTVDISPRVFDTAYGNMFDVSHGMRSGNQTVFFEGAEIIRELSPALYWRITYSSWHKIWQVAHLSVSEIERMEDIPDMPSLPWDAFQEEFVNLKKATRSSTLWRSQAVGARSGYKLDPYDLKHPLPFVEPDLVFESQKVINSNEGKNRSQREVVVEPRFDKILDGLLSGGRNSWDSRFSETGIVLRYHKPYEIKFKYDNMIAEFFDKTIDEFYALNNDFATKDGKGAYKEYFSYKKATRSSLAKRSEDTGGLSGYPMTDADLKKPLPFEDNGISFEKQPFAKEEKPSDSVSDNLVHSQPKFSPERVASNYSENGGHARSGHRSSWVGTKLRHTEIGNPIKLLTADSFFPLEGLKGVHLRSIHETTVDTLSFKHLKGYRLVTAESSLSLSDIYDHTVDTLPERDESSLSTIAKPTTEHEISSYKRSTRSFSKRRSEETGGRSGYFLSPIDSKSPIPFVDVHPVFEVKKAVQETAVTKIGYDSHVEREMRFIRPKHKLLSGHKTLWDTGARATHLSGTSRTVMAYSNITLDSIMDDKVYRVNTFVDNNTIEVIKNNKELLVNTPMSTKGFTCLKDIEDMTLFDLEAKREDAILPKVDKSEVSREFVNLSPPTMSWNTKRSDTAGGLSGYELTTSDNDNLLEFKYKKIVVSEDILIELNDEAEISSLEEKETQLNVERKVLEKGIKSGHQELFVGTDEKELELGDDTRGYVTASEVVLKSIWSYSLDSIEQGAVYLDKVGKRHLCSYKRVNASSHLVLNAVIDEPILSLDQKLDVDASPADKELVSYDYPSRSGKAFRSGKVGTLDSIAGARSGYELTDHDLVSPIAFEDKVLTLDKTTVVEAPEAPEMDIRRYKEFDLKAVSSGGGVLSNKDAREIEIGEDVKIYSAFSSATLQSIYYDTIDVVTTRRDMTPSPDEALRFYKVITSHSILGWKGFENLEAIYDYSVFELDSLPDLLQNPVQREVIAV